MEEALIHPVRSALLATLFTWGVTAAGASLVFFFKSVNRRLLDLMLGFAAGAMLYVVAVELLPTAARGGALSAAVGFTVMMVLDVALG